VDLPGDMMGLIESGDAGLEAAQRLTREPAYTDDRFRRPLAGVTLLPPLDPPRGNILAIGRNYAEHAGEIATARGEAIGKPTVFTKAQTTVTGPYDDIPLDQSVTKQFDWEAELGVVIGRRGKNIPRDTALDHVFGYVVVNDLSPRDIQYGWGGQFFKGKSLDSSCPLGPWIVTRDEVPNAQSLRVLCRVNGEVKQDANTSDMIFPVDEIVSQMSVGMTLLPGAMIATGTPHGVGFGRTPQEFLQPGDVVETEIEGVGLLRNRIV
jgi:2-keto-4-pentenoate hydratase/2-oxohepta-3-ene-1,7-dioic acid hydratase in catechol pathway